MSELKDELWPFAKKHPIVTIIGAIVIVGWTSAIIGALFTPCQTK